MFQRNVPVGRTLNVLGMRMHWLRIIMLLLLMLGLFIFSNRKTVQAQPENNTSETQAAQPTAAPLTGEFLPVTPQPTQSPDAKVKGDVHQAVNTANAAFRSAHKYADVALLNNVATGDWLEKERSDLDNLRNRGETEIWEPIAFQIIAINAAPTDTLATVCTNEQWARSIIDANGNRSAPERFSHTEKYTLTQSRSTWQVSMLEYDVDPSACN